MVLSLTEAALLSWSSRKSGQRSESWLAGQLNLAGRLGAGLGGRGDAHAVAGARGRRQTRDRAPGSQRAEGLGGRADLSARLEPDVAAPEPVHEAVVRAELHADHDERGHPH